MLVRRKLSRVPVSPTDENCDRHRLRRIFFLQQTLVVLVGINGQPCLAQEQIGQYRLLDEIVGASFEGLEAGFQHVSCPVTTMMGRLPCSRIRRQVS